MCRVQTNAAVWAQPDAHGPSGCASAVVPTVTKANINVTNTVTSATIRAEAIASSRDPPRAPLPKCRQTVAPTDQQKATNTITTRPIIRRLVLGDLRHQRYSLREQPPRCPRYLLVGAGRPANPGR